MTSIFESTDRTPVEYLPTGDHAILMAWAVLDDPARPGHFTVAAVVCLEDGRVEIADTENFKFDYRWSERDQKWYDVSKVAFPEEGPDADADQADADHGSSQVP